jgi:hypothetical protein
MTDLSTPANEIFSNSGTGIPVSQSISEIIHGFIIERMPPPGQPLADAALHHFAALARCCAPRWRSAPRTI